MDSPDLEPIQILSNNTPLDDFCGLTPTEVHHLLYDTFGEKSPLKFHADIDNSTLDGIPFFRLTEELLKILERDRFIKLTLLGALPRKTLHELYDHKFITEGIIESGFSKLTREIDSVALRTLHITTQLTGTIKKSNSKLTLTKKGERFLHPQHRVELFKETLSIFTDRFNWAANDAYTSEPIGQLGWGFTIYILDKFGGEEHTMRFYADKYLCAFPKVLNFFPERDYMKPENQFYACYSVRTFERFLEWFGFVTIQRERNVFHKPETKVKRSELMGKVFRFE
jgi:hypothetical protein